MNKIEAGNMLRDAGMRQAVDHADRENNGWSDEAYGLLQNWIINQGKGSTFKLEDFRLYCEKRALIDSPPDDRAYGHIVTRAAKAGLIKNAGFIKSENPVAHRGPRTLWKVL
jgi:hypothetical protein